MLVFYYSRILGILYQRGFYCEHALNIVDHQSTMSGNISTHMLAFTTSQQIRCTGLMKQLVCFEKCYNEETLRSLDAWT